MNIVDSSGWLEYFADGENAEFFSPAIRNSENLLVPVITLYEVFKRIHGQSGLNAAEYSVMDMHKGKIIDIDPSLAISAALLSAQLKLPMADSLILATVRAFNATLWTQDAHFAGLEGVEYIEKHK
jgi:predicted nucleic acid-binding protein